MPPPVITTVPFEAESSTAEIDFGPASGSVSLVSTSIAVAAESSALTAESSTATGRRSTSASIAGISSPGVSRVCAVAPANVAESEKYSGSIDGGEPRVAQVLEAKRSL